MEQTIGKRIVANRKGMAMTQDALAEQLGVTAQAVSKWENDQSCPDITMIPRLAEIFGITTDQLLGVAPKAIIPPEPEEEVQEPDLTEQETSLNWELQLDKGSGSHLAMAVWVLLTGGLLLASHLLGWGAGFWDILWPVGLMVLGLFWASSASVLFRLTSIFFGGYFLLCNLNLLPAVLGKGLLFAIFLILFGISLLLGSLGRSRKRGFRFFRWGQKEQASSYTQRGEKFACSTKYGEDRRTVTLPVLSCGQAKVSFGSLKLDLTGCGEIAKVCTLALDCAFAEMEVYIPGNCRVEPETKTAFGGFDIQGSPAPDADCTLRICANVGFGEITGK